jgi:hypothetical protein
MLSPTIIGNKTCIITCKQITLPKKWVMKSVQFKNLTFQIETMHFWVQIAVFFTHPSAECVKDWSETFQKWHGLWENLSVEEHVCLPLCLQSAILSLPLMINTLLSHAGNTVCDRVIVLHCARTGVSIFFSIWPCPVLVEAITFHSSVVCFVDWCILQVGGTGFHKQPDFYTSYHVGYTHCY